MPVFHYVVLTQAVPGRLEEFEKWYDEQHLQDVVAVPGVRSAKRYRLMNQVTDDLGPPPFDSLAIYEIDADDPLEATRVFTRMARTPAMPVSDALVWDTRTKIIGKLVAEVTAKDGGEK